MEMKPMRLRLSFFFFLLLILWSGIGQVKANYITIQNATVTGATSTTAQVQYDIFWENSWRDAENWDAAWVFVKYNTGSGWNHATLSSSGHVVGTSTPSATINVSSDFRGAFIYRSSVSSGTFTVTGQQLQWNFNANGLTQTQATTAQVRIYGIEMVYIPTGTYALGDGNGTTESTNSIWAGANNYAYAVSGNLSPLLSADALMHNGSGAMTSIRIHGTQGVDNDANGTIDNPDFPLGFLHFYIMKYEISQGQYAEFLNTLTTAQATARFYTTQQNRYTISVSGGVYSASRPDRACNFIDWIDGCAYTDWACLRPLTECEYEKACRGSRAPLLNEYPNGTTSHNYIHNDNPAFTSNMAENGTETAAGTTRNAHRTVSALNGGDGGTGPVRVGIFGRSVSSRTNSGASYYGVMDMGSNLAEYYVTLGNVNGRSYTGVHGDGALFSTSGVANVNFWPGINGNSNNNTANTSFGGSTGVTSESGIMLKSDPCAFVDCETRVSQRFGFGSYGRGPYLGFRSGRTAP